MTWVITETQQSKEVVVFETKSYKKAVKFISNYTDNDINELSPCLYKRRDNGTLTTDY